MTFTLRDYQSRAVESVYDHLRTKVTNPCVVLPTGAGKSLVIAKIATDSVNVWGGRVLVLQHVKELIEQNAEKIRALCPELNVGIYSAGLGKREAESHVVVAGIQSVYKRAEELGRFDIVIVDEAHLIPPDGDGMYRQFFEESLDLCPHQRVIGLTATPYRLKTGLICAPENILHEVCCEVGVKELIADGYLSKLVSKEPIRVDTGSLHVRGGEFIAEEAERLMLSNVKPACQEIVTRTEQRNSVLVFCQGIEHAMQVKDLLQSLQPNRVELVIGDTPSDERAEFLRDFKAKAIKYLVNVNVLTTGFDAPNVDCVALLRPTLSAGLYMQMVGRGFRLADGKLNCLVLDFAGNVRQHGPVDCIRIRTHDVDGGPSKAPVKKCPSCDTFIHAAYSVCTECAYIFPDREASHDREAGTAPVLSGVKTVDEYDVIDVRYSVHEKRNAPSDAPKTLRVEYRANLVLWFSEWVCIEHDGFAGNKARLWWRARSNDPFPNSAQRAADIANGGGLAMPKKVWVESTSGEKFPRIKQVELGEKPEAVEINPDAEDFDFAALHDDDIPAVDWSEIPW